MDCKCDGLLFLRKLSSRRYVEEGKRTVQKMKVQSTNYKPDGTPCLKGLWEVLNLPFESVVSVLTALCGPRIRTSKS